MFGSAVKTRLFRGSYYHFIREPAQMARKTNVLPTYLLHKPTGQARVRINGRDYYLGTYGSPESRIAYGKLIASQAGGLEVDPVAGLKSGRTTTIENVDPGPTVAEICLSFLRFAEKHYVKRGKPTTELGLFKDAMRHLVELYGSTPAASFGPLALKAVRLKMVESGLCRNTINQAMARIRRIFKHAVANELIEPSVLQKLQAVSPLLQGRTDAHDNPPRTAVSDEDIEAVRSRVTPLVRDLIDIQRLTGSRSGELLQLTTGMIDRSGDVWAAKLMDHKTAHHGQGRTLHFGPQSQLILQRYLSAKPDEPIFGITRNGYRRGVTRACELAGITRWVPHQLRNTAASAIRDEFGLESTQAVLGHAKSDMTEHYAAVNSLKAQEVARRIG